MALPERLQDGLTLAVSVLIESLPFVMLGVVLAVVIQVWVPPGAIERWLPRRAWARRAVLSLLGILVPVCECGNVPFARGLLMRGFSVPETMTFLIAAPIVNPIVIITTHQAFGFSDGILVARILGGYAIANLIGGGLMVNVVGLVKEATGSYALGLLPVAALDAAAAISVLLISRAHARETHATAITGGAATP